METRRGPWKIVPAPILSLEALGIRTKHRTIAVVNVPKERTGQTAV